MSSAHPSFAPAVSQPMPDVSPDRHSTLHIVMATNDLDERRDFVGRISADFPDATIHPMLARGCKDFMEAAIANQRVLILLVLEKAGLLPILFGMRGTNVPQWIDRIFCDAERNPVDSAVRGILQELGIKDRIDSAPRRAVLKDAFMRWLQNKLSVV